MKQFTEPEVEIISLEPADIVTASNTVDDLLEWA